MLQPMLLYDRYSSLMIIELYATKKLPRLFHMKSGNRRLSFGAGTTQQLRGIRFQHVTADLTLEVLPFPVRLYQAGPHQLLDVVRDRGLGNGKLLPQLGARAFTLTRDHLEHGHPTRIGQSLGDQLELLVSQGRAARSGIFHSSMVIELSSSCQ
jgi:hypothetical protein